VCLRHFGLKTGVGESVVVQNRGFGEFRIFLFPRENTGSKSAGGGVTTGRAEVAMCVWFAQMLKDGAGGGGGLFVIAEQLARK